MKIITLLLSTLLGFLSYANAEKHIMDWSPEAVAAINFTLSVDIGDTLILTCNDNSFSNLIFLDNREHWDTCNTSSGNGKNVLRGACIGFPSNLTISILQPSASLSSDPLFVAGVTRYFTSFSTGADIRTSYNDITSGGECISDNLKLAIAVRARDIITTENEDIFTDNVSDTASSDGIAISNQDGATTTTTSNKMNTSPITPQGLLVNGCSSYHVLPMYSILTCTLLTILSRLI